MTQASEIMEFCKCGSCHPCEFCKDDAIKIGVRREIVSKAEDGDIASVKAMVEAGVPFSCVCGAECDAEVRDLTQAVLSGWQNIFYVDYAGNNFTGDCPDCVERERSDA